MELEEKVKFFAAEMLITLSDKLSASQKITNYVVNAVDKIVQAVLSVVKKRLTDMCAEHEGVLDSNEVNQVLNELIDCSAFEGLKSPDDILTYIKEEHGVVMPEKVVFLRKDVLKGDKVVTEDVDFGYVVPFQPALKEVLSCPEVLECVKNPLPVKEGVFTSALDGYFYRNHPVVKEHPGTLGFNIYSDGIEPTDSASSKSGLHGTTLIYWSLLNIYPHLRSSVRAIFLLGAVKTSVLKKYGYAKILESFIETINKLKDGLHFMINGKYELFYGIFVCCCGDNPASAHIGGFKETHFANHHCRQCLVHFKDMYQHFNEDLFPKRSKESHLLQVEEVEAFYESREIVEQNPSVLYGINSRSALMNIEGCDVTKCLPQDLMHDTIMGTLKVEICCLLSHVLDKKEMTLKTINNRIAKFGKYFGANKPSEISANHLEKKNLRQTAAETISLAHILPFALRKWNVVTSKRESACDEANLNCYILRLQLLDLLMSKVLTFQDVDVIRATVKKHHTCFQALYPESETPKLHYEVHMGTHILLYGPPSEFWCCRYEAKHAFFKRLFRIKRCLKNLVKTMSFSHQRKQAGLMLLSKKGNAGPFLTSGNSCGAPIKTLVSKMPYKNVVSSEMPEIGPNDSIEKFVVCQVNGVKFKKHSAVVTAFHKQVPVFGEVQAIFRHIDKIFFVVRKLDTVAYERSLHSFRVKYTVPRSFEILRTSNLVHTHQLPYVKTIGGYFINVPSLNYFKKL
ncbi:Uracil-DNA glycosylase [Frankliniella fusca]|uniref:Uracil-DNA glycosylase n=1 Tax=Frankliniella fusca TaxID=407009 RepID=A0AAE1LUG2_9NEOP|nr:Uracil-DNA glycosylase [Frankliniella fusca]